MAQMANGYENDRVIGGPCQDIPCFVNVCHGFPYHTGCFMCLEYVGIVILRIILSDTPRNI